LLVIVCSFPDHEETAPMLFVVSSAFF